MALNNAYAKQFDVLMPRGIQELLGLHLPGHHKGSPLKIDLEEIRKRFAKDRSNRKFVQKFCSNQVVQSDVISQERWLKELSVKLDFVEMIIAGRKTPVGLLSDAMDAWTDGWMQFGKEADPVQIDAWCKKYPEWTNWIKVHDRAASYSMPEDQLVHAILHDNLAAAEALLNGNGNGSAKTPLTSKCFPAWLTIKIFNCLSSSRDNDRKYPYLVGALIRALDIAVKYNCRKNSLWCAVRLNTFIRDNTKSSIFAKYVVRAQDHFIQEQDAIHMDKYCRDAFDNLASDNPLSVYLLVIDFLERRSTELDEASADRCDYYEHLLNEQSLMEDHEEKLRKSWPPQIQRRFDILTDLDMKSSARQTRTIEAWAIPGGSMDNQDLPAEMLCDE